MTAACLLNASSVANRTKLLFHFICVCLIKKYRGSFWFSSGEMKKLPVTVVVRLWEGRLGLVVTANIHRAVHNYSRFWPVSGLFI